MAGARRSVEAGSVTEKGRLMQKALWCTCLALGLAVATTAATLTKRRDIKGRWRYFNSMSFTVRPAGIIGKTCSV